jgi:hypothetical protein
MAKHGWKIILGLLAVVLGLLWLGGTATEEPAAPTPPAPASAPPIETRKTIGKTTQNVLDLAAALAQGGVRVDAAAEAEEGGLGAYSQAYRHTVAFGGSLACDQKMKFYEAEHGTMPATHSEFMAKIIAPGAADEIRLPMLPYYQEYAFDPESRKLVVVEFPAKKRQRQEETTGASGL